MKESLRDIILDRFKELVYTYGVKRITIDKLAQVCGISKKTVYKFYTSKDEIVYVLADSIFMTLRSHFEEINKSGESPLKRLYKYFEMSFVVFRNFPINLLEDIQKYYPEINSKLNGFIEELGTLFTDNYKKGVELGQFIELNPKFVVGFFMGASVKVFNPEFILKNNLTIEETLYSFRTMLISALVK